MSNEHTVHAAEQPPKQSAARRYLTSALKVSISIVLLVVLFRQVDMVSLWARARSASMVWLVAALAIYSLTAIVGTWRWHQLLDAQSVHVSGRWLLGSFLVANFFNNFLPSNIGGDVVRIGDTAKRARSKTLATTVVMVDRVLGLMGLVFVAAAGATIGAGAVGHPQANIFPSWLWAGFVACAAVAAPAVVAPEAVGRLLRPLTVVHPEWVGGRLDTFISTLARFKKRPGMLAACFIAAVGVQATLVVYYLAVVYALHIPVRASDLAVIVPLSFVVQMLPVSVNGFGVREATFSFYFKQIGLPIDSAVLMSLVAAAVAMLFSLSGAAVYVSRHTHPHHHH